MKSKRFDIVFFIIFICGMAAIALPTLIIDPLFHYHAPLQGFAYKLNDERYQNNGIVRNFTYDALVTGTSMTENFSTTQMDDLFGVTAVKVPYSGGSYTEINDNIEIALKENPDLKMVLRATDFGSLLDDKDAPYRGAEDGGYPYYLIDGNPLTDVSYLWNKSILLNKTWDIVKYTRMGGKSTTFDDYAFWQPAYVFGKRSVLSTYERSEKVTETVPLTEEERHTIQGNIRQNVAETALAYPEVDFYVFIPPYSICYWDTRNQAGLVEHDIDAMEVEIQELVGIDNVRLFAFGDREDIVCNLANYKDIAHYGAIVNREMLRCMERGRGLLTEENYQGYLERIRELYIDYDYDSIYE